MKNNYHFHQSVGIKSQKRKVGFISVIQDLIDFCMLKKGFQFLSIFVIILCLWSSVQGQTNIYTQNFGTGTSFPTGWSAAGTNTWTINSTNPSPTPTFSGGSNLSSGSSNNARTVTFSNNLSTVGYSNITILWGARRSHTQTVTCEWSPDGSSWNTLTFTEVANNSTWAWINGGTRISLPIGASGVSNLSFRWTYDSDGTAGRYRIDDFTVEGCLLPAQPSTITGSTTPCVGSSQTYSVTNVSGVTYNWTFPTGWTQTGGGTTNSVTVTVGTGSGNITVTPSNACGNGTARTLAVTTTTVPAQPSTITGSTSPCQTSSQTYSVTNVASVTYTWTFPTGWTQTGGGTTNSVSVTVGTGSGNITVTPSNACGNGTARTLAVTTTTVPAQPSTITGSTSPCQTSSQTYSVTNVAGVTYTWTFPTGWTQTGGGTTNSVTVTVGTGSGNITVTPSNACGNGTARTLAVTTATVPAQPSTITGSTSPCQTSSQTYSVTNVAGVTYTWTFPAGWTQSGGGTTNSVTVTVGTGSGNITVTPSNTCGNGTARTLAVTTTTAPAQPSTITGSTSPCQTSSQTYSVTNVAGVTYNWTFPAGWTQTGGGTTNSVTVTVGANSGNITVTPSNACGNGTARTLAVAPTTVPTQPSIITGSTTPCQTSSQNYSVANVSGVTYNWTFPAGWTQSGGGTTNSITATVGATSGNIQVTPSNSCGNGTSRTLAVTVSPVPAQPSTITGNTTPLEGFSETYSVTNVSGVTYNWTFPSGWVQTGGGTTNSVVVTVGSGSGNITVTPSNACGNGTPRNLAVTVTLCVVTTFPWTETFEGTFLPSCWSKIVHTGGLFSNDITRSNQQNHTTGGTYSARFSSYYTATDYNQYLFTPPIHISAGYTDLSFWARKYNTSAELLEWGVATTTNPDDFTWFSVTLSETQWNQTIVDLSAYAGQNIFIGFHYYGNYLWYVYLDDVSLRAHVPQAGLWTGNVSTNWNTTGNWDNGVIPTASTDVTIPWNRIRYPNITGNAVCNNLRTFGNGSVIVSTGGTLTVNGSFNNAGALQMDGGTCSITGNLYTPSAGTVDMNGGILSMAGWFETTDYSWVSGTVELSGGTINVSGTAFFYGGTGTMDGPFNLNVGGTLQLEGAMFGTVTGGTINLLGTAGTPNYFLDAYGGTTAKAYNLVVNAPGSEYIFSRDTYFNTDNIIHDFTVQAGTVTFANATGMPENFTVEGNVTVAPGAYVTAYVNNAMTVTGNLTLQANSSAIASWIDNSKLTVTGTSNAQLYLTPSKWHYVSSPVANAQSGVFLGIYLRSFNEQTDNWNPYIVPTNVPLSVMLGYAAWVPGSNPATVNFQGTLNTGNKSIGVTRLSTLTDKGWNLVGNPYPSSLNWDATGWTKTNVNNTIYFYSGVSGLSNYHYYIGTGGETPSIGINDGTNRIPPMQGFFVHASANGTLGVTNATRVHSNQAYYKNGTNDDDLRNKLQTQGTGKAINAIQIADDPSEYQGGSVEEIPLVRLQASGNGLTDETVVRFFSGSGVNFDDDFDAYKLFGDGYPQIYSISQDQTELAINTLPVYDEETVIPIGFTSPDEGEYTITLSELIKFESGTDLYLEDLQTGIIQKITEDPVYTFTSSPIDEFNRFLLHFSNPMGISDDSMPTISVYAFESIVYVQLPDNNTSQVVIYDLMGQEILRHQSKGEELVRINVDIETGYYLVKVQTGEQFISQKVFIK
jgi:hypothetical protein